ncbi:MAG: hypothetical protein WCK31_04665, partial [bacterium]
VPTNPISIFDENNSLLEQTELDSFTNFSIRLKVNNLDITFPYYKVVCVERTNVNNVQTAFVEGIHPTTDDTIIYTSSGSTDDSEYISSGNYRVARRIDMYKLYAVKPVYEKAKGNISSGNRLFKWGLQSKTLVNLQPVVNLFGSLLKWQSSIAKEDLYKNAIATSKYKGYMRNEVYPFALRLFNKDGSYTATFPLIGRPADSNDLAIITDKNYQSLTENTPNCTVDVRNKKWQIFNTASENKRVGDPNWNCDFDVEIVESTEDIYKTCLVENVATIPAGSVEITENLEDFTTLENYIEENPDINIPGITSYLENTYPTVHCDPKYNDCSDIEVTETYNTITNIVNEVSEGNAKILTEYGKSTPPSFCSNYITASDGTKTQDTAFADDYFVGTIFQPKKVYKRQTPNNETCSSATSIIDNTDALEQVGTPYYHKYYGSSIKSDLLTAKNAHVSDADFDIKLHKGALFFKVTKNNRDKLIFEITPISECTDTDSVSTATKLRYTIYESCTSSVVLGGGIFNTTSGVLAQLDITSYKETFYIAIDAPIATTYNSKFVITPSCGCFTPFTRNVEYNSITVTWDNITLSKTEKYKATCNYSLPRVNDCEPVPFAQGEFSYWESTEEYPNNSELYDSSELRITDTDLSILTEDDRQKFKKYFTVGVSTELNTDKTDFRCKKIRHFKMPDNTISPFISHEETKPFVDSYIFPLGVTIDNEAVKAMLVVAFNNKLITQEELDNIEGFEILRGDNSIHKSVIANGLGYDMYKYDRSNKPYYYANYPFNDLGQDLLHYNDNGSNNLIQHPFLGEGNNRFSVISPDLVYQAPTLPTEVVLSGYQLGSSKGKFVDVKEHPKWVILGNRAKTTADILAGLEFALEKAIQIAEFTTQSGLGNSWFVGGAGSSGGNVAGSIASSIAIGVFAASTIASAPAQIGKYRYQWLKTFRDLGTVYNFASYNISHGHHNFFAKNLSNLDYIRGLSLRKYMKDGEYTYIDENNNDRISVNNKLREHSVLISTGNYNFTYSTDYKKYDNNKSDSNTSSRTIMSQNNCEPNTEYTRNVGSPYLTLKNYVPDQYGSIGSIK